MDTSEDPVVEEAHIARPTLPATRPNIKQRAVATTVYLMPEDHHRIRVLAAETQTTFQALVMDGLDRVLNDRNMPALARWAPHRKQRL